MEGEVLPPEPKNDNARKWIGNPLLLDATPRFSDMRAAMEAASRQLGRTLDSEDPDPYGYAQEMENAHGADILPINWKASPDDTLWNQRVKARARKVLVARYLLMGLPVAEIARRLKVRESMVYSDVHAVEDMWRESAMADIEILAARDLARLDQVIAAMWPAVEKKDPKAASVVIDAISKRGDILGYKQGVQIDIEAYIRQVAESLGYDPDKAVEVGIKVRGTF